MNLAIIFSTFLLITSCRSHRQTCYIKDTMMICLMGSTHVRKIELKQSAGPQIITVTNTISLRASSNLSTITNLYLGGLSIEEIEPHVFVGLSNLVELHLDHNLLVYIRKTDFTFSKFLEILDLSFNLIRKIDGGSFFAVRNLRKLYLGENLLAEIRSPLAEKENNLEVLDLSGNPLRNVFGHLDSIEGEIFLNETLLTKFRIPQRSESGVVNIYNSRLLEVDVSSRTDNGSLQLVNLASNKIIVVKNLQKLKCDFIQLQDNNLTRLGRIHSFVEKIYLQHNSIRRLDEKITAKSRLRQFDASFNFISFINKNYFLHSSLLTNLNLKKNKLSELHPKVFQSLKKLQLLDLSHNEIIKFKSEIFDSLVSLKILDVSYNKLLVLHSGIFANLKELNTLQLRANDLISLNFGHVELGLAKLRRISLNGNDWYCPVLEGMIVNLTVENVQIVDKQEEEEEEDEEDEDQEERVGGINCNKELRSEADWARLVDADNFSTIKNIDRCLFSSIFVLAVLVLCLAVYKRFRKKRRDA